MQQQKERKRNKKLSARRIEGRKRRIYGKRKRVTNVRKEGLQRRNENKNEIKTKGCIQHLGWEETTRKT
jgi:hypothetical protein